VGYDKILKTTNSGINWMTQSNSTNGQFSSVHFSDHNTGWVVGATISFPYRGIVLKTSNGGISWIQQNTQTTAKLNSVRFADINTGWVVGDSGVILKTTNGGNNWVSSIYFTRIPLLSVFFENSSTGWVVGDSGTVAKTTNGGLIWTAQLSGTISSLYSVCFIDQNTGWVVGGYYGGNGRIIRTTNSGTNWTIQTIGSSNSFSSVHFTDNNTGWVVGNYGTILKTTTGGEPVGIQIVSTEIPEQYSLSQNYPNPFNPKTIINYELRITNLVKLTVYDVIGHEVAVLVNEKQLPGTYEVEFDGSGLSSGVYFYKLVTEDFTDVKRMMLVK
jgi:hypothetical protein